VGKLEEEKWHTVVEVKQANAEIIVERNAVHLLNKKHGLQAHFDLLAFGCKERKHAI
jgi:hypothetical protein